MTFDRLVNASLITGMLVSADAAMAGIAAAPSPAVGVGIGAVALIGLGYRALRNRIGR